MIDSFILSYAIFSLGRHIINYKRMPWNLPERNNYKDNVLLTVLCYLSKCIPVNRGGSREKMRESLEKCIYLLNNGETIMIFRKAGAPVPDGLIEKVFPMVSDVLLKMWKIAE